MLEVCIFSNGIVVETWLTNIPKTSVYPNKKTFEKAMEYRNNTHKYRKIPDELLEELNNNKHRGDEKK